MSDRRKLIKASEIGEYVFCARAWRLRLDGHAPTSGHKARQAGTEWHLRHGRTLRRARRLRLFALCSLLLAAVAAAVLLFLLWWRK
jgi:type IV secretory pathway TrbF-like protein